MLKMKNKLALFSIFRLGKQKFCLLSGTESRLKTD